MNGQDIRGETVMVVKRGVKNLMKNTMRLFTIVIIVSFVVSPLYNIQAKTMDDGSEEKAVADKRPKASYLSTPTLRDANTFDYIADSVINPDEKMKSADKIADELKKNYGCRYLTSIPGMPLDEYKEAFSYLWKNCTVKKKPIELSLDISEKYSYDTIVKYMKALSRYEGVYLYQIGETQQGRPMYALEIDVPSEVKKKKTVVLTGSTHARETAGTVFIIKHLIELLQADTEESKEILSKFSIVAVPCTNPDGREGVAFDTKRYTYSNGKLWKGTANGTDLNRNFPGLVWSQVGKGNSKTDYLSSSPKKPYYPGTHAGSIPETKAMMKFLYYYVVKQKAAVLIDYHQQGSIGYAGKPWDSKYHRNKCHKLADAMFSKMNKGNSRKYKWEDEESGYGLIGTGSTLTDYATSIAYGAKFSPAYGFCVYTDGDNEYPLCAIPKMDKNEIELIKEPNRKFACMTFEIGYGKEYLGYGSDARRKLAKEYNNYHFGQVLYYLAEYLDS